VDPTCPSGQFFVEQDCMCRYCGVPWGTCEDASDCVSGEAGTDQCTNGCCCAPSGSSDAGCVPGEPDPNNACCSGRCNESGTCL
jgi:hypothetical protein